MEVSCAKYFNITSYAAEFVEVMLPYWRLFLVPTYSNPLLLHLTMCRYPLPAGSNTHFLYTILPLLFCLPTHIPPASFLKENFQYFLQNPSLQKCYFIESNLFWLYQ